MEAAMAKILKGPVPVKVPKYPYQAQALRDELTKYESAGKIRLSRFQFWKRTPGPIERQVGLLKAKVEALENEFLEGFLCPISEAEMWECRAYYTAMRLHIRRVFKWNDDISDTMRKDQETAVDLVCDSAFVARQILCSLKRKVGEGFERILTEQELTQIDPRVFSGLYEIYAKEFLLTEDEKKN
jgi:hypothetical protein